jgi:hypothetical protein
MKYIGFILGIAGIYVYFFHHAPTAEVKTVVTAQEVATVSSALPTATPAPTNSLKRPLDRTREVLGQVRNRNAPGEF